MTTGKVNPADLSLAWLMANRERIAEALAIVDALKRAQVIVGGSGSQSGVIWNGSTVTIVVPG